MNEQRIATIVKEIEYWKEHKILPDQQCDFLLALYTNGEREEQTDPAQNKMFSTQHSVVLEVLQITLLFMLLPFSFLVLYFTEFHSYLQLGILMLFLLYSAWMYFYVKQSRSVIYHVSLLVSLFLFLLLTISAASLFLSNSIFISIIIILNFLLWFIMGMIFKLKYLLITSVIGILFIIIYTFI